MVITFSPANDLRSIAAFLKANTGKLYCFLVYQPYALPKSAFNAGAGGCWIPGTSWTRIDHALWLWFQTFIIFSLAPFARERERGYQPISPPFIANPKAPSFPATQLPGQTVLLNYCIFLVQCLIYLGMRCALKEAPVAAEEADCSRSSHAPFLWYPQPLTSLFVL